MGVVSGQEQSFAEDGLAVSPGNLGEEIGLRIFHQGLHGLQVSAEFLDAGVPGSAAGRGGGFRPVVIGPFRRLVPGVAAEFEDVRLGEAQVFEEHPEGVREVGGFLATEVGGEVGHDRVECGVGVASVEQFEKMLAE